MLKLISYDFTALNRRTWLIYALSLLLGMIVRFGGPAGLNQLVWLYPSLAAVGVLGGIACVIGMFLFSWLEFKNRMFGKEAYLYQTFPVSFSKTAAAWFCASFLNCILATGICLLVIYLCTAQEVPYSMIAEQLCRHLNLKLGAFIAFAEMVMQLFCQLMYGYLGMIMGYKKPQSKLGWSILWGLVFCILTTLLMVVILWIGVGPEFFAVNPDSAEESIHLIKTVFPLVLAIYIPINLCLCALGCWKMSQGIDL